MERKYWAPAIERADAVLKQIAAQPSRLKLTDLTALTGINKSTMFSLLQTLETLEWVKRDKGDTYTLGPVMAMLGNAYFSNFNLLEMFMEKAAVSVERIGETVQLAKLENGEVLYLAKKEAASPVRLISQPGMRIPAYATALGKMLLSALSDHEIVAMYPKEPFEHFTPKTLTTRDTLLADVDAIRSQGFAVDHEEIVPGFTCVAAPIYSRGGEMYAAASFSMRTSHWESKNQEATEEIRRLARQLSSTL